MRDIVTAQEMKDLDRSAIENAGVLSLVLMERAALKTVEEMKKRWKQEDEKRFWWYAEAAMTGGDGLAIARLLHLQGISVSFYFPGKRRKDDTGNRKTDGRLHEAPKCHRCIT